MPNRGFCRGIKRSEHRELWSRATSRTFAAGETLFHQGDTPTEVFCVEKGRVKLWRASEAGATLTLNLVDGGEVLGAVAVMQDRPHSVNATALTEVLSSTWPASLVRRLVRQDPALAADLASVMANKAEELVNRVEDLSSTSVEARVARTLTRLGAQLGRDGEGRAIELAITQREIADLTFSTVPTVSRVMKRWRMAGLISAGRGRLVIHDLDAVCALRGID